MFPFPESMLAESMATAWREKTIAWIDADSRNASILRR
jgi:hypothetical protein